MRMNLGTLYAYRLTGANSRDWWSLSHASVTAWSHHRHPLCTISQYNLTTVRKQFPPTSFQLQSVQFFAWCAFSLPCHNFGVPVWQMVCTYWAVRQTLEAEAKEEASRHFPLFLLELRSHCCYCLAGLNPSKIHLCGKNRERPYLYPCLRMENNSREEYHHWNVGVLNGRGWGWGLNCFR